jgi:hypothetical protein
MMMNNTFVVITLNNEIEENDVEGNNREEKAVACGLEVMRQ